MRDFLKGTACAEKPNIVEQGRGMAGLQELHIGLASTLSLLSHGKITKISCATVTLPGIQVSLPIPKKILAAPLLPVAVARLTCFGCRPSLRGIKSLSNDTLAKEYYQWRLPLYWYS
jgi:hypothetical protein